jgi:ribosomal-protein-alanine N-acetyltransferase
MSTGGTLIFKRESEGAAVATLELMRGVDEAEILNIDTAPSHRRRGLAASLLIEAFAWCAQNNRSAVWLEVRASNDAAIALYRKTGFVPISIRSRYYSDGEDALVMKYTL